MEDINALEQVKLILKRPVVISKLIWSEYFQKQTTDLCNRVVGVSPKCGIYKITNINTGQCYIGQAADISKRFKEHIKCGLGIEASATNKLYNAMQKEGVHNFTFEVLEECSDRSLLNQKEALWIKTFQSNEIGYNSNKGIIKA